MNRKELRRKYREAIKEKTLKSGNTYISKAERKKRRALYPIGKKW